MKRALFVLLALMAALTVISLTVAITRSSKGEDGDSIEEPAA
jgi:hypothetical protein